MTDIVMFALSFAMSGAAMPMPAMAEPTTSFQEASGEYATETPAAQTQTADIMPEDSDCDEEADVIVIPARDQVSTQKAILLGSEDSGEIDDVTARQMLTERLSTPAVRAESTTPNSGTLGSCSWTYNPDMKILTIKPTNGKTGYLPASYDRSWLPWKRATEGYSFFPYSLGGSTSCKVKFEKTVKLPSNSVTSIFRDASFSGDVDISGLDTSEAKSLSHFFARMSHPGNLVVDLDISNCTDISWMFSEYVGAVRFSLSNGDKVTSLSHFFDYADSEYIQFNDAGSWTKNSTDMTGMFANCHYLKNLDVSGLGNANANCRGMFSGTTGIQRFVTGTRWDTARPGAVPTSPSKHWWSVSEERWYTNSELASLRRFKADTYLSVAPSDSLSVHSVYVTNAKTQDASTNVLSNEYTLDRAYRDTDLSVYIAVNAGDEYNYGYPSRYLTYRIVQGDRTLVQSNQMSMKIPYGNFAKGKAVFLCVMSRKGKLLKKVRLNIKVTDSDEIPVPKSFGLNNGAWAYTVGGTGLLQNTSVEFPAISLPVTATYETNGKVLIGLNFDISHDKNIFSKMRSSSFSKDMADGRYDSNLLVHKHVSGSSVTLKPEFKVMGALEGDLNTGIYKGTIAISGGVSAKLEHNFGVVVVGAKFKGTVGTNGSLTLKLVGDPLRFEVPAGKLQVSFTPQIEIYGGIGVAYICNVSAYGKASAKYSWTVLPWNRQGLDEISVTGSAGVKGEFLGNELFNVKVVEGTYYAYRRDTSIHTSSSVNNVSNGLIAHAVDSIDSDAPSELVPRDFAPLDERWVGGTGSDDFDSESPLLMERDSYGHSAVKIAANSEYGATAMVWLDDVDGKRGDANRTVLMYSVRSGRDEAWSEPQAVLDDGTADFSPQISVDEYDSSRFHITWLNASEPLSDDATVSEKAELMDVMRATIDMGWDGEPEVEELTTVASHAATQALVAPQVCEDGTVAYEEREASALFDDAGVYRIKAQSPSGQDGDATIVHEGMGLVGTLAMTRLATGKIGLAWHEVVDTGEGTEPSQHVLVACLNDWNSVQTGSAVALEDSTGYPEFACCNTGYDEKALMYINGTRLMRQDLDGDGQVVGDPTEIMADIPMGRYEVAGTVGEAAYVTFAKVVDDRGNLYCQAIRGDEASGDAIALSGLGKDSYVGDWDMVTPSYALSYEFKAPVVYEATTIGQDGAADDSRLLLRNSDENLDWVHSEDVTMTYGSAYIMLEGKSEYRRPSTDSIYDVPLRIIDDAGNVLYEQSLTARSATAGGKHNWSYYIPGANLGTIPDDGIFHVIIGNESFDVPLEGMESIAMCSAAEMDESGSERIVTEIVNDGIRSLPSGTVVFCDAATGEEIGREEFYPLTSDTQAERTTYVSVNSPSGNRFIDDGISMVEVRVEFDEDSLVSEAKTSELVATWDEELTDLDMSHDMASADLSPIPACRYDGSEKRPEVSVSVDGTPLEMGRDYEVSYTDNVKPGKGLATVSGLGEYVGSQSIAFVITPRFQDVNGSTSHNAEIDWLAAAGISMGWRQGNSSEYVFRPYENVARADMAAFLFRLAVNWGLVDEEWGTEGRRANWDRSFVDVDEKTPHYREILWLADNDISVGWKRQDGQREFRPYASIARQDMAAFLFRLAKLADKSGANDSWQPSESAKARFCDVNANTPHAREIWWLAEMGISTGWNVNGRYEFRGISNILRCDMSAFLKRTDTL